MAAREITPIPDRTPNMVFAAARQVALNLPSGFKLVGIEDLNFRILLSGKMSLTSWGEKITIQIYGDARGGSVLEVVSQPKLPTQVVDWGKGKTNVSMLTQDILHLLADFR